MNLSHCALAGLVLTVCCQGALAEMTPEQVQQLPVPVTRPVDFAKDIELILRQSCVNCPDSGCRSISRRSFLHPAGGDWSPPMALNDNKRTMGRRIKARSRSGAGRGEWADAWGFIF